jgi:hypothetical protein
LTQASSRTSKNSAAQGNARGQIGPQAKAIAILQAAQFHAACGDDVLIGFSRTPIGVKWIDLVIVRKCPTLRMPSDSRIELALMRQSIEALNAHFAWLIGHEDGLGVADLFTEQGVYDMSNGVYRGRVEINGFYGARKSRGRRTARHLFTNLPATEQPGSSMCSGRRAWTSL